MSIPDRMFKLINNLSRQGGRRPCMAAGFVHARQDSEDGVLFADVSCMARLMPPAQARQFMRSCRNRPKATAETVVDGWPRAGDRGALEAAAFSVPDRRLGEGAGACGQLRDGAAMSRDAAAAFVSDDLGEFTILAHRWHLRGALTRGATDKH